MDFKPYVALMLHPPNRHVQGPRRGFDRPRRTSLGFRMIYLPWCALSNLPELPALRLYSPYSRNVGPYRYDGFILRPGRKHSVEGCIVINTAVRWKDRLRAR